MQIIFIHGWGTSADYWNDVKRQFQGARVVDLGFTAEVDTEIDKNLPAIYVTHSLGTLYALKKCASNMHGLVAINGFTNFKAIAGAETLQSMQDGLKKNPQIQMQEFYKNAGFDGDTDNLNIEALSQGLKWLEHWDVSAVLQSLNCPVLALAGAKDKIVPLSAAQDQWAGHTLEITDDGGHNLPQSHSEWCIDHIRDVIE